MIIKDHQHAVASCNIALKVFPNSPIINALLIRSLAERGEVQEALLLFKERIGTLPDPKEHFALIEAIAWGALIPHERDKGSEISRLMQLIGASLTRDAKAVQMLQDALRSSNAFLRSFAIKLSCQFNDRILQKEIIHLVKEEKNWYVRMELIQAIGAMRLKEGEVYLTKILDNRRASNEEKAGAIQSLVALYDDIPQEKLEFLLTNKRAGLRGLGVALIGAFDSLENLPQLLPLLKDPSALVRINVLGALGTMLTVRDEDMNEAIIRATEDSNPHVAIMASWVVLQYNEEIALKKLEAFIKTGTPDVARFAAAALGMSGMKGWALAQQLFTQEKDPFIRANLAIGMVKQRVNMAVTVDYLHEFLLSRCEKMMWERHIYPMFAVLAPSTVRHVPHIKNYPAMVDQLTRLELINTLSIIGCKDAKSLVKDFLRKEVWGVTGTAAVNLLEEGDLEAIEVVRELLQDKDEAVRIQAALALAFYGKDPSVVPVLQAAFATTHWEEKVHILEAIGHIGSRESIPFLLEVMEQPFHLLRTIAASGVIQCLYH